MLVLCVILKMLVLCIILSVAKLSLGWDRINASVPFGRRGREMQPYHPAHRVIHQTNDMPLVPPPLYKRQHHCVNNNNNTRLQEHFNDSIFDSWRANTVVRISCSFLYAVLNDLHELLINSFITAFVYFFYSHIYLKQFIIRLNFIFVIVFIIIIITVRLIINYY